MRQLGDALASAVVGPGLENPGAVGFTFDTAAQQMRLRLSAAGAAPGLIDVAIDQARIETRLALPLCESPIERTFLPALICADYDTALAGPAKVHLATNKPLPNVPVVLVPQFWTLSYRLDFALVIRAASRPFVFAVECDGDAYHESMKDFERDRVLASWGVMTVRLRGSEIYADAISAAHKVSAAVLNALASAGARI